MFNERLQKIGRYAFYNCISLSNITLPSTITEIGDNAFDNCTQLRGVVFNRGFKRLGGMHFMIAHH